LKVFGGWWLTFWGVVGFSSPVISADYAFTCTYPDIIAWWPFVDPKQRQRQRHKHKIRRLKRRIVEKQKEKRWWFWIGVYACSYER
jgi:hypothetical protein